MTVTPEVLAELRRLHAELTATDQILSKALMAGKADPFPEQKAACDAEHALLHAWTGHGPSVLDELEAVRAERDRLLADVATYQRTMSICVSEGHKDAVNLVKLQAAAREMLDATFENGCSGHSDVAEQCPICRAHGKLSAALGAAP